MKSKPAINEKLHVWCSMYNFVILLSWRSAGTCPCLALNTCSCCTSPYYAEVSFVTRKHVFPPAVCSGLVLCNLSKITSFHSDHLSRQDYGMHQLAEERKFLWHFWFAISTRVTEATIMKNSWHRGLPPTSQWSTWIQHCTHDMHLDEIYMRSLYQFWQRNNCLHSSYSLGQYLYSY